MEAPLWSCSDPKHVPLEHALHVEPFYGWPHEDVSGPLGRGWWSLAGPKQRTSQVDRRHRPLCGFSVTVKQNILSSGIRSCSVVASAVAVGQTIKPPRRYNAAMPSQGSACNNAQSSRCTDMLFQGSGAVPMYITSFGVAFMLSSETLDGGGLVYVMPPNDRAE